MTINETSILHQLDELAERIRQDWQIPGLAVSMVSGGAVLAARGYGTRTIGGGVPVDGDTLYSIGSCTKSFTAAALALLVDEGKLTWDDPVIRHLPDFALPDPWVTQHVTVRDLLAHRLGLRRATATYYHGGYDQRELVRRMRYYETAAEFRSDFVYDNAQYTTAGLLVEAISGLTWSEFVRTRLFAPLGMARSRTRWSEAALLDNRAGGHVVRANADRMIGAVLEVPWQDIGAEAAGSIAASARDLAHWLIMLLNGGSFNGQPVISPQRVADLHSPQVVAIRIEETPFAPMYLLQAPTHFWTYGLGFYIIDYRGQKMVIGGGQIRGHNALFVLLPQLNAGFSILANVTNTAAHLALAFSLADRLIGGDIRDWNAAYLEAAALMDAQADAALAALMASRQPDQAPSQPLAARYGTYTNQLFGDILIDEIGFHYGRGYVGTLEHWHDDSYLARWDDAAISPLLISFAGATLQFGTIGAFTRV